MPVFKDVQFDFFGDSIKLQIEIPATLRQEPTGINNESVKAYSDAIKSTHYTSLVTDLLKYREQYKLDDWLYYQLIRKTVEQVSPKAENYQRYTVNKWFLLTKSGYGATLKTANGKLLFFVQTDEQIFNLPYYMRNGRQYVCLNFHDYPGLDIEQEHFSEVALSYPETSRAFTYKVTQLPNFAAASYIEKDLSFSYSQEQYHFKIKLNQQVKNIFANYPVVDYASYFNIPLSNETYQSLIPMLKKAVEQMSTKDGVDFLMHFTRYAFLFETDTKNFGQEKRLSPEQTLLYEKSDCEDRAALFFFLTKEIYQLPMIVLAYPEHVTVAVKFMQPVGEPIAYNGGLYSVCEPTPQKKDLKIGRMIPALKNIPFEVVYAYQPANR